MPRDGEEAKTPFFVYFGGDHSTPCYLGQEVIDTSCSRFLIGRTRWKKRERCSQKVGLSMQKIKLDKAMTFRFGNDETLETKTMAILPVGIAGGNGVQRVHVVPGGAPLLLSKEFLKDLGCHIGLGRGHLFLEKLGVRAVVTSKQSPHLLLHLTNVGSQGKIKTQSWIASASERRTPETDSIDTESLHGTDEQEQNPCDDA